MAEQIPVKVYLWCGLVKPFVNTVYKKDTSHRCVFFAHIYISIKGKNPFCTIDFSKGVSKLKYDKVVEKIKDGF